MFQFALVFGPIIGLIGAIIMHPWLLFIPLAIGACVLIVAIILHLRDKRKAKKFRPLPCDGHKGTWSNPEFFSEEELKSKD